VRPVLQAFWLLRAGFTVAPVLFGLDKLVGWLTDWSATWRPKFLTWFR
jgi:hypothetical protein